MEPSAAACRGRQQIPSSAFQLPVSGLFGPSGRSTCQPSGWRRWVTAGRGRSAWWMYLNAPARARALFARLTPLGIAFNLLAGSPPPAPVIADRESSCNADALHCTARHPPRPQHRRARHRRAIAIAIIYAIALRCDGNPALPPPPQACPCLAPSGPCRVSQSPWPGCLQAPRANRPARRSPLALSSSSHWRNHHLPPPPPSTFAAALQHIIISQAALHLLHCIIGHADCTLSPAVADIGKWARPGHASPGARHCIAFAPIGTHLHPALHYTTTIYYCSN